MLPVFEPDQTIVVEERWHGRLWSAVPHRVISSNDAELISYVPAGTTSVVASNRGLPGTEGLDRSGRKLRALEDLRVRPMEISESPTKLYFHTANRWARVNLGWDPADGRFMGWYVNFERPVVASAHGVQGKDLVLDLYVNADRTWAWKDRDAFETAITRGVLTADLRGIFEHESHLVLEELEYGVGPFAARWQEFEAPSAWTLPELPSQFRPEGSCWTG